MKKKILFPLLFFFHILLWAENNKAEYYNLNKIQASFPTSKVERKATEYETISIENPFQGYVVFLYHYPEESLSRKMYYDTLQLGAQQNLIGFFSETGYTTLLDPNQGVVYGFFSDKDDFVSVRFTSIDSIPSVLDTLNEKFSTWTTTKTP